MSKTIPKRKNSAGKLAQSGLYIAGGAVLANYTSTDIVVGVGLVIIAAGVLGYLVLESRQAEAAK